MPKKPIPHHYMSESTFWRIVQKTLDGTDSIGLLSERQQELLEAELELLSYEEFVGFYCHFITFFEKAYRNDLWAVAYIVMGGCSDDCFMDFRTWLVYRGESVYKAALKNPDSLCKEFEKIPDEDIPLWEYYLNTQFDARFGEGACNQTYEEYFEFGGPRDLLDPQNAFEGTDKDTIKQICPEVYAKWNGNDVF